MYICCETCAGTPSAEWPNLPSPSAWCMYWRSNTRIPFQASVFRSIPGPGYRRQHHRVASSERFCQEFHAHPLASIPRKGIVAKFHHNGSAKKHSSRPHRIVQYHSSCSERHGERFSRFEPPRNLPSGPQMPWALECPTHSNVGTVGNFRVKNARNLSLSATLFRRHNRAYTGRMSYPNPFGRFAF